MFTTSQYIFDNLFQEGKDSDVTLNALGSSWKLHKLYLCQSAYFESMFSGRWSDSKKDTIDIVIEDPNVTIHSLHITLGSFYKDELTIEPSDVVSVLATARLFQLDGLLSQCLAIMEETVNVQTAFKYHESSLRYGCVGLEEHCRHWLLINLLSIMPDNPGRLREIPPSLMGQLIESPHLFVMQTEFSIYVLLRLWMFLRLRPAWSGEPCDSVTESQEYFRAHYTRAAAASNGGGSDVRSFLETAEAAPFLPVFRNIRLPHLLNHHMDVEILVSDRIIPDSWMTSIYYTRWMTLLRIDSGVDLGPQNLSEEVFNRECLRCGRTLNSDGQHMWRWTGFNAGLDLIVTYDNYKLTLKRSNLPDHEALVSTHRNRHIAYRVMVLSVNDQKQPIYQEGTGITEVTLSDNEVVTVLELDPVQAVFPLSLSFNFCVVTPLVMAPLPRSSPDDESGEDEED